MRENELKFLSGIGALIGAVVGCAIAGSGSGMAGLAVVMFCGLVGAAAGPVVLPLLALACIGIFSLCKKCCCKDDSAETTQTLSVNPAPAPARRSSLSNNVITQNTPTLTSPSATVSHEAKPAASPTKSDVVVSKSADSQNTSFAGRFFSFFTSWSICNSTKSAQAEQHQAPASKP